MLYWKRVDLHNQRTHPCLVRPDAHKAFLLVGADVVHATLCLDGSPPFTHLQLSVESCCSICHMSNGPKPRCALVLSSLIETLLNAMHVSIYSPSDVFSLQQVVSPDITW